ncbi:hypothetical protein ACIBM4_07125 [Streptomyces sp. NPDC050256]|uniref:hypothetical protein n=1 Tax=unclassified Streptomyces TaxID=2593676 RepID=UPI0037AA61D0
MTQMIGQLSFESRLQHPLRQLLQQPTLTGQLQPAGLSPGHHLSHQSIIHTGLVHPGTHRHVSHQLPLSTRELHRSRGSSKIFVGVDRLLGFGSIGCPAAAGWWRVMSS